MTENISSIEPHPFAEDDNLLAQRLEFATTLGLEEPVSLTVLEAALRDANYARNLLASRRSSQMLTMLLRNPPPPVRPHQDSVGFSNSELLRKAAVALSHWAKTGFSVVDAQTLNRRRLACENCPNIVLAPDRLVYKLTPSEALICNKCGCKVHDKTRLPSESCPDRHPVRDGVSRWDEPWRNESAEAESARQ